METSLTADGKNDVSYSIDSYTANQVIKFNKIIPKFNKRANISPEIMRVCESPFNTRFGHRKCKIQVLQYHLARALIPRFRLRVCKKEKKKKGKKIVEFALVRTHSYDVN